MLYRAWGEDRVYENPPAIRRSHPIASETVSPEQVRFSRWGFRFGGGETNRIQPHNDDDVIPMASTDAVDDAEGEKDKEDAPPNRYFDILKFALRLGERKEAIKEFCYRFSLLLLLITVITIINMALAAYLARIFYGIEYNSLMHPTKTSIYDTFYVSEEQARLTTHKAVPLEVTPVFPACYYYPASCY